MFKWLRDLNSLVHWFRRDFQKQKAVFIYADGRKIITNIDGPVTRVCTIPIADAGIIENPNALPTEMPRMRKFVATCQSWDDPYSVTVYEESVE